MDRFHLPVLGSVSPARKLGHVPGAFLRPHLLEVFFTFLCSLGLTWAPDSSPMAAGVSLPHFPEGPRSLSPADLQSGIMSIPRPRQCQVMVRPRGVGSKPENLAQTPACDTHTEALS